MLLRLDDKNALKLFANKCYSHLFLPEHEGEFQTDTKKIIFYFCLAVTSTKTFRAFA